MNKNESLIDKSIRIYSQIKKMERNIFKVIASKLHLKNKNIINYISIIFDIFCFIHIFGLITFFTSGRIRFKSVNFIFIKLLRL